MSRRPCTQCGRDSHSNANTDEAKLALIEQHTVVPAWSDEDIGKLQLADPSIGFVFRAKETDECPNSDVIKGESLTVQRLIQLWPRLVVVNGILWRLYEDVVTNQEWKQLVVPQVLREEVMGELHGGVMSGHLGESKTLQKLKRRFYWPMSGHLGESKTLQKLKRRFYWPGHSLDIKTWCQTCSTCASRKTAIPKNCAPLQTIKQVRQCRSSQWILWGPFLKAIIRIPIYLW